VDWLEISFSLIAIAKTTAVENWTKKELPAVLTLASVNSCLIGVTFLLQPSVKSSVRGLKIVKGG
jgi:hypothetical protein